MESRLERTESWREARVLAMVHGWKRERERKPTWNDIPGIHGVLVLDETEAVHKLDLGNLSGAMGREVRLNIGLGRWGGRQCLRGVVGLRGAARTGAALSRRVTRNSPFRGRLPK